LENNINSDVNVNINNVDIRWNLKDGSLSFLDISSTLFWNDPSLLNMFHPLVKEIGKEMFCLQVAYSSSLGTDLDYNAMVTQLGDTFEEGFLNWGKAVSAAGWGSFEVASIDFEKYRAKVIVHNPWELLMQKSLHKDEQWGCPFLQGKIIGIFNNAFKNTCWASEKCYHDKDNIRVEFDIFLHNITIKKEISNLRAKIEKAEILNLERIIKEKIKERDELLRKEEIQLAINENLEKRVKEEIEKNRKKEQHLQVQTRMAQMGEMISMIAHQWRQPLGAISSSSANLQVKLDLQAFDFETREGVQEASEYFISSLKDIDRYVQSLTNTIDDFRNFYKPNRKKVSTSLKKIVFKALGIIKSSLQSDNVKIIEQYNDYENIELHDSEMMQVILNILKNAQDNFKEKQIKNPKITIKTYDRSISISDNGGGIPKHIINRIFEPYFSTKESKNGTGLGLYMSKMIVEDHHNGKLLVKNKNDGVCFSIDLSSNSK